MSYLNIVLHSAFQQQQQYQQQFNALQIHVDRIPVSYTVYVNSTANIALVLSCSEIIFFFEMLEIELYSRTCHYIYVLHNY